MKNLTMANIENIALKVSADIFATTVAYPNHWIKELEAISNIELSQTLHHNIILESLFFGIYYVNSRLKNTFSTENQNEFEEELINRLIWSLSNLYFASETKDTTAITEDTKELFSIFLPPKLKEYATFKKGNIGLKLKENLFEYFKSEGFSISEQTVDNYINSIIKDFQEINVYNLLEEEGVYSLA